MIFFYKEQGQSVLILVLRILKYDVPFEIYGPLYGIVKRDLDSYLSYLNHDTEVVLF